MSGCSGKVNGPYLRKSNISWTDRLPQETFLVDVCVGCDESYLCLTRCECGRSEISKVSCGKSRSSDPKSRLRKGAISLAELQVQPGTVVAANGVPVGKERSERINSFCKIQLNWPANDVLYRTGKMSVQRVRPLMNGVINGRNTRENG